VGAALYLGFFGYGIWRFRRDRTPYGIAGVLVLLLSFVYMFTYDAVGAPLGFTMLSYALLWKSSLLQPEADLQDTAEPGPARLAGRRRRPVVPGGRRVLVLPGGPRVPVTGRPQVPAVSGRPQVPVVPGRSQASTVTAGGLP
jgi:hypothetical protein